MPFSWIDIETNSIFCIVVKVVVGATDLFDLSRLVWQVSNVIIHSGLARVGQEWDLQHELKISKVNISYPSQSSTVH